MGVVCATVLLTGCGDDSPRDFIGGLYTKTGSTSDTVNYHSNDPVGQTASKIAGKVNPAARASNSGKEFLRYDQDIVIVSPATPTGSDIAVEDLDARFKDGAYSYLGSGFTPGSAAEDNENGK